MNSEPLPLNPDSRILILFRDSNRKNEAFKLLLATYQERLYWHVRRMVINHEDANDVIQNVFLKVWKNLNNFRADSKLYTWLYRIASNEAITFLKQKRKRLAISIDNDSMNLSEQLRADQYFDSDELNIKLQKAIATLPDKQKLVFHLRYYEEMKYEDMAEVTGTSVGALKASYHHAAKKIEKFITGA